MNPNQPQAPNDYPPAPSQGSTPPQPPQIPVQHAPGYDQPMAQPQSQYPPQQSPQWSQPGPQPSYTSQPTPVPDGMASIDYLNQISSQKRQATGFSRNQLFLLGGLLILALGTLLVFLASGAGSRSGPTELAQTLILRTGALVEVTEESQKHLKSQSLSNTNTALRLQLQSTQTELTKSFSTSGMSTDKPSKALVAAESNASLLEKLDDARLNSVFDRVYTFEMSHQLETTLLLIDNIHTRSSNEALKAKLEEAYNSLEPLYEQIKDSDSATS